MGGIFKHSGIGMASKLVSDSTAGKILDKTPAGKIRKSITEDPSKLSPAAQLLKGK